MTQEKVKIEIWTSYLTEDITEKYSEEYVEKQKQMFSYDPENLITGSRIIGGRNIVLIEEKGNSRERPHLVIAGCTRNNEASVKNFKGTGLLVARYSIFYGEPSAYTGNYPEESGYTFDLPKETAIVKALLKHDDFLEGIVAREGARIRSAVDRLNATIKRPVLVTDYLSEALGYR